MNNKSKNIKKNDSYKTKFLSVKSLVLLFKDIE